jgi:mannose-6-phosphate isomerase-like protein (cupin superfamily)
MGAIHHVPPGSGPCITYAGQRINLKVTAAESGGEVMIMEDAIDAGAGPPLHVHERENEAYYVLEGEFEFVCGDDRVTGGPGTFVYATRGVPHRYRNVGPSTGRLLFTFTPPGSKLSSPSSETNRTSPANGSARSCARTESRSCQNPAERGRCRLTPIHRVTAHDGAADADHDDGREPSRRRPADTVDLSRLAPEAMFMAFPP